ncbi:hypothetical protein N475_09835 [Pseudoalteromonas luteoviolacea DSM 6061]|uniref:Uncharacterized protein n=1 Tax=Pseudoalteromonas luteoviolacea DSM 6061 TaxID=1365250 RepID=A0A166YH11_9GAMM|nr:hypothetical protein N475_09835 [Pseudoalteromonas luteoviolacea DSM 6061]
MNIREPLFLSSIDNYQNSMDLSGAWQALKA